jgi:hypothetical protein
MHFPEPLADLGLDLLDSFLLDGLLRGWTPQLFFSDLQQQVAKARAAAPPG